jgi:hypothetical protein
MRGSAAGRKMRDSQDKETSTDEVQNTRKYKKEKPAGSWMSLFCEC